MRAVDASQVKRAVTRIGSESDILTLDPHSFSDALADIKWVGRAAGRADVAETLTAELAARVEKIEQCAEAAIASNGQPLTAVVD